MFRGGGEPRTCPPTRPRGGWSPGPGSSRLTASSFPFQLTACVHGAVALLYPMYWQHIYIPVLPPHLLDYCW